MAGGMMSFASFVAMILVALSFVKGFKAEAKLILATVKEQVTAYGASLQAGFGIQRTLALNH